MSRILMLMTTRTYRAAAFLEAARVLGHETLVASDREQALAGLNPAGHLVADFDDPAAAVAAITERGRSWGAAAVVAADDEGAPIAAAACAALGLRFHSVAGVRAARGKFLMREALAAAGAKTPFFRRIPVDADAGEAARGVPYPCVLKPLALSASRGVVRADDARGFAAAFARVARVVQAAGASAGGPWILVESFLPGDEIALEGVVEDGRLHTLAIFDKPDPLEGPFFEETLYVTPSRLPQAAQDAVKRLVADAARAIGLGHGPIHAEVRIDAGEPAMVEIAPRSIGGLCSRALRFTGGDSLETLLLRHALGEPIGGIEREAHAAGVLMLPIREAGVLRAVRGCDAASRIAGIEDVRISIPIGDRLVPPPEGGRYLGFVFARAAGPAEVEQALRAAQRSIEFEIEPEPAADAAPTRTAA